MELSAEMIDYLHNEGRLPEWAYYQINGKTAGENYREQKKQINKLFEDTEKGIKAFKERREKEVEDEVIAQAEKELPQIIQSVLDDLLPDL